MFQNYSRILLGVYNPIAWREIPISFYVYFILTFILSFILITPRIYIIWVILLIWNVSRIFKKTIHSFWIHYNQEYSKEYIDERRYTIFTFLFCEIDSHLVEIRQKLRFIKNEMHFISFDEFVDS
jgi:hypothetical protein